MTDTGNRPWVEAVYTAPNVPGHLTDASTAVTFTIHLPDGTEPAAISSPHADIVGPTAGTVNKNGVTLATTTWHWKVPLLTQAGKHVVRHKSTAGIVAQDSITFIVDQYTPFTTP